MADDFDDDLFNAYNQASDHKPMDNSHESFEDEFADALDTTKDDSNHQQQKQQDQYMTDDNRSSSPPPPPPRQQQQQNSYNNYTNQQRYYQQGGNQQQQQPQTVMMGGVPMPYQMALAYQQQMQQMMANPLQFQMMQQQYRQMQQQQQQQQHQQRRPYQQRSQHPPEDKEALERKMFIGGLDWDTTDDSLKEHFSKFGPVASCAVMRESMTGQSRGFGFVSMLNASDVDKVLEQKEHFVDGKKIDPKRAVSRSEQPPPNQQQEDGDDDNNNQTQAEKIFVGGISPLVDRDEFKQFFEQFGTVVDATLMMDRQTGKPRGFGFITFEDVGSVDRALDAHPGDLEIKEKRVEIKRATPKTRSSGPTTSRLPNTRYAGAAQGRGYQQQPYAAMAAAAYYTGRQQPQQQNDDDDYHRRNRDHHYHRSSRHRDSSRDDRYRGSDDHRSGGGAVHASSTSRNQSSYRPY